MPDPLTRDEFERECGRMRDEMQRLESRVATGEQGRWGEHSRQHVDERVALSEFRAEFKEVATKFSQLLSDVSSWRSEIKGQLVVLKWLLAVGTAVLAPLLVALALQMFW